MAIVNGFYTFFESTVNKLSEIPDNIYGYTLEKLQAQYSAAFSDTFPTEKQLIALGICNILYWRTANVKRKEYEPYEIPQYTKSIIRDMDKHLELPKITLPDVQKYMTFLFENKNTEGLYSLYWIIKNGGYNDGKLPVYLKFVPQNGVIAIDRKHAVISPLIQEQLTQQFFEMKEKQLKYIYNDLNAILNKISAKYFPCFAKFTENTNNYYIGEIDSNNTQLKYKYFSIYLNNWVIDPDSEIKEIERLYEKAPCIVIVTNQQLENAIKLILRGHRFAVIDQTNLKGKNIAFLSLNGKNGNIYVHGEKPELLDEILNGLSGLGYKLEGIGAEPPKTGDESIINPIPSKVTKSTLQISGTAHHPEDIASVIVNEQTAKDNLRIYLGKSDDNNSIYWEPDGTNDKPRMVSGNILITGGAGSGKTETLKSVLYELNRQGYICLALGFHPDLTIEGFKYTQITAKSNIGINPLDFDSLDEEGGGLPIQVYNVVERLKNTYPTIGDIQESNLIEILEEAYKTKGISENKETWKKTCPNFEDVEKILNDKISQTNDKDLIRLRNKLSKIFKFNIFSKKESIDFNELFQKSTILDLSKLPDDFLFLVSDTILRKMYRNLKLRNPIEFNAKGKKRFRIFIAIDEAKILVPSNKGDTKAIINIFGTEARKFGVGFIVSSQLTSHFGDDVLGNMATKIALKPLKHNIAKDNAKELSIESDDLMNIKNPGEGFIRFSNEETKKIFLKSYDEKVKG